MTPTKEQIEEMRKAVKTCYATLGSKVRNVDLANGFGQMGPCIDALCDLALRALAPTQPVAWRSKAQLGDDWRHHQFKPQAPERLFACEPLYAHPAQPADLNGWRSSLQTWYRHAGCDGCWSVQYNDTGFYAECSACKETRPIDPSFPGIVQPADATQIKMAAANLRALANSLQDTRLAVIAGAMESIQTLEDAAQDFQRHMEMAAKVCEAVGIENGDGRTMPSKEIAMWCETIAAICADRIRSLRPSEDERNG